MYCYKILFLINGWHWLFNIIKHNSSIIKCYTGNYCTIKSLQESHHLGEQCVSSFPAHLKYTLWMCLAIAGFSQSVLAHSVCTVYAQCLQHKLCERFTSPKFVGLQRLFKKKSVQRNVKVGFGKKLNCQREFNASLKCNWITNFCMHRRTT